ncbi:MAG: magnesium/cobalt transporter CorA [Burkholderiaceae bacterium]|nr:MAG: magnesium/cobalt transporter CorA [Burkholderiaceae bacterium]
MLINCVAYQDGKKLADITVDDISEYVAMPDCFVWVALSDPGPGELAMLQKEFGLHELAVEDASKANQRPKVEEYGESLFLVMHVIETDADGEMQQGEVDVFVGKNYVLSIRTGAKRGFAAVRARCEAEPALLKHGSGFVMYALMDNVVDRYFPILDTLENELERIEEHIFQKSASARLIIEDLYTIKRRLMVIQHAAAPLLEATSRLYGGRVPPVCAGLQDYYRDVYDHLSRIVRGVEARREMVTTAIQVNIALISLSETEVSKRLASYAALFAVPTMIAGIYGMNFHHMPELDWDWGYPLSLLAMVGADVFLWWRFKKARWL